MPGGFLGQTGWEKRYNKIRIRVKTATRNGLKYYSGILNSMGFFIIGWIASCPIISANSGFSSPHQFFTALIFPFLSSTFTAQLPLFKILFCSIRTFEFSSINPPESFSVMTEPFTESSALRAAIPVLPDVRIRLLEISAVPSSRTIPQTLFWKIQFCKNTVESAALRPN